MKKKYSGNFTTVSNNALQNKQLSIKARGLFITMWSLPDDWEFSITGLASILPDGKGAIRSAINELEEQGYLLREQINNGKFGKNIYVLHDDPVVQKRDNAKTDDGFLDTIKETTDKELNKKRVSNAHAIKRNWTY